MATVGPASVSLGVNFTREGLSENDQTFVAFTL